MFSIQFSVFLAVASLAIGFLLGFLVNHLVFFRPLLNNYHSLRRVGYVPHMPIAQRRTLDPSESIVER